MKILFSSAVHCILYLELFWRTEALTKELYHVFCSVIMTQLHHVLNLTWFYCWPRSSCTRTRRPRISPDRRTNSGENRQRCASSQNDDSFASSWSSSSASPTGSLSSSVWSGSSFWPRRELLIRLIVIWENLVAYCIKTHFLRNYFPPTLSCQEQKRRPEIQAKILEKWKSFAGQGAFYGIILYSPCDSNNFHLHYKLLLAGHMFIRVKKGTYSITTLFTWHLLRLFVRFI